MSWYTFDREPTDSELISEFLVETTREIKKRYHVNDMEAVDLINKTLYWRNLDCEGLNIMVLYNGYDRILDEVDKVVKNGNCALPR